MPETYGEVSAMISCFLINLVPMNRCTCPATASVVFLISMVLATGSANPTPFQPDLRYKDRGDRYEGIKGFPVSDRIELLSAMVDYEEPTGQMPPYFKIKFFLKKRTSVFVTVRETNNRRNYWLDRIRPSTNWQSGFANEFSWPTDDVIRPLKDIGLYDLSGLARLEKDDPSVDVRVAPCILFYSQPPARVDRYIFGFRLSQRADVDWLISRDEKNAPTLDRASFKMPGRVARVIRWDASQAKDGWYRLKITVIFSSNGKEVNQIVRFYHRAVVKD